MICAKLRLIFIFTFISGVYSEVTIEPDEEELFLTTGANFVLKCIGDVPVGWHYPPSVQDGGKPSMKTQNQYQSDNGKYVADLSIEAAHYLDTGFYYCASKNDIEEAQIYVYVRDANNLLAIENPEDDPKVLLQQQYDDLIIPCRPTFPDVNVTLERDPPVDAQFDPQKGFVIHQSMLTDSGEYICEASRDNQVSEATFTVTILPRSEDVPKPEIFAGGVEGAHIIVGQTVEITCKVIVTAGVKVTLDWDIPQDVDKKRITFSDLSTDKVSIRGIERRKSYKKLTITDVKITDEGIYTCRVTDHSRNTNQESYRLEVHPVDMKYLNLTMEGKTDILVRASEKEAQWIVHIDAYPTPSIKWYGPDNNSLSLNYEKYTVSRDSKKTKITIHNISIKDSGVYTLHASNVVKNETLKVTLFVEDRPQVSFQSESKAYYDINKEEVIDCIITAYPRPTVTWNFVECTDHKTFCSPGNTVSPIPMEPKLLVSLGHVKWHSRMKWYARESGIITCRAENHLGVDESHLNFKVTDVNDGFDIWGPKHRVLSSDSIHIGCGASIYEYNPEFDWIYKSIKSPEWIILTNSSLKGITIMTNKTSFSYQTFLDISRVTADNSGTFKCRAKSFTGEYNEKEFKLLVQTRRGPTFTNFMNMNGSTVTIRVGRPITWNCSVVGLPEPDVVWYKNNKLLDGKNSRIEFKNRNHTLHIAYTDFEDGGLYKCEASNSAGMITAQNELKLKGAVMPSKIVWWVLFVLVGFILIFLVAMIFFCRKYKSEQKKRKELMSVGLYNFYDGQIDLLDPSTDIGEQAECLPYDKKWEFPREKLKLGKTLGCGAFGVVLKGEAMDLFEEGVATTVAVKMVKKSSDFSHVKSLATELKIMAHLGQHLNVVNLLGACTGNVHKRELLVIVEYCRYGSLHKYLLHHKNSKSFINQIDPTTGAVEFGDKQGTTELTYIKTNPYQTNTGLATDYSNGQSVQTDMTSLSTPVGEDGYLLNRDSEILASYQGDYKMSNVRPISTQDLFCWGFQVAKGMEYLASRKVLHGDLAARNILLAEGNVVKICDFGLAKSMYSRENYRNKKRDVPLPVKWMSIEAIQEGVFSTQSDIWSFGVVLWEMFSLAVTPYPGLHLEDFYNKLLQGYRMEKPPYATDDVYNLMLECWKEQPMLRPSFTECAERLGNMLGEGVREHYLELNCPYLKFNEQISGENDHLGKLAEPTYENSLKTGMPDSMPEGYVCMKAPKQDAMNEVELRPMITPGCNSFLNPGYQDLKNFKEHKYTNLCQDSTRGEAV